MDETGQNPNMNTSAPEQSGTPQENSPEKKSWGPIIGLIIILLLIIIGSLYLFKNNTAEPTSTQNETETQETENSSGSDVNVSGSAGVEEF